MNKKAAITLVAGMALGMAIIAPISASAHDKVADISCQTATVSLTNYDSGATAEVVLDGVVVHTGTFDGAYSLNQALTSDATTPSHTLTVTVRSNDGEQYNLDFTKTTDVCYTAPPAPVTPNSVTTSSTVACGVATITLRNVSPWIYPVTVEIDGVSSYGPTVDNRTGGTLSGPQKDASATRTITFPEDSGEHTVRYRVAAGSEKDLYKGLPVGEWTELTVQSDCVAAVVPPVEVPPAAAPELPETLAYTGVDQSPWMYAGALASLLLGLSLVFRKKISGLFH